MASSDTDRHGLPVPLEAQRARPSLLRIASEASFVSQLIAERDHLPPQRARRRASTEGAIGAYAAGARITVRRMPAGYRTTIVA